MEFRSCFPRASMASVVLDDHIDSIPSKTALPLASRFVLRVPAAAYASELSVSSANSSSGGNSICGAGGVEVSCRAVLRV